MIYTRDDLTPQWPRSRRMATCSCQDRKPHGPPFAVWVSGCKEWKLVLVSFHKVRIDWQCVGRPKTEAEALRTQPPGRKGSPQFPFSASFPSRFMYGEGAPDRLAGTVD